MEDSTRIEKESLLTLTTNLNKENVNIQPAKVYVEPCQIEFFYERFKHCYPMYKNPRGQCLIINIYQINGMPPRRWSDRDTDALKQLFEQLLFNVTIYTDSTHDLNCQNFKKIIKDFSEMSEHEDAQCSIICLMSHGEEGYLTTKEGDKVLLDEIFTMFNNINCPNLAGKPKLFFIQSCRDDPVTGPAEDLGIKLSFTSQTSSSSPFDSNENDQSDGSSLTDFNNSDNNGSIENKSNKFLLNKDIYSPNETLKTCVSSSLSTELIGVQGNQSQVLYHIPSLCDMLIGFPTQKGFIAYRKPEIGSWYMNAIVQIFSKHSHNTDLCAMLNMVNSLISNEVTNTGKKQMSEYTSKLTKPYFYFFPGLASDSQDDENELAENDQEFGSVSNNKKAKLDHLQPFLNKSDSDQSDTNNHSCLIDFKSNDLNCMVTSGKTDNLKKSIDIDKIKINQDHIEFISDKARFYWKHIAREINLSELQIVEIERACFSLASNNSKKLKLALNIWLNNSQKKSTNDENDVSFNRLINVLTSCRLNKIKDEFLSNFNLSSQ